MSILDFTFKFFQEFSRNFENFKIMMKKNTYGNNVFIVYYCRNLCCFYFLHLVPLFKHGSTEILLFIVNTTRRMVKYLSVNINSFNANEKIWTFERSWQFLIYQKSSKNNKITRSIIVKRMRIHWPGVLNSPYILYYIKKRERTEGWVKGYL